MICVLRRGTLPGGPSHCNAELAGGAICYRHDHLALIVQDNPTMIAIPRGLISSRTWRNILRILPVMLFVMCFLYYRDLEAIQKALTVCRRVLATSLDLLTVIYCCRLACLLLTFLLRVLSPLPLVFRRLEMVSGIELLPQFGPRNGYPLATVI